MDPKDADWLWRNALCVESERAFPIDDRQPRPAVATHEVTVVAGLEEQPLGGENVRHPPGPCAPGTRAPERQADVYLDATDVHVNVVRKQGVDDPADHVHELIDPRLDGLTGEVAEQTSE